MTKPRKDLSGQRFGRLVVIRQGEDYVSPSNKHRTQWQCQCDCGNTVLVEQSNLIRGNSNSCGCLNLDNIVDRSTIHGDRRSRLYSIWTNMKTRCNNTNSQDYYKYGGRGVSICSAWNNSYESFKEWALSSGYIDNPQCTLDRIDVNGNYEPENCRWATPEQQANNRRNTINIAFRGEEHTLSEWAKICGIKYHTLFARLYILNWPIEKALAVSN